MANLDGGAVKRKNGEESSSSGAINLESPPCSPASHATGSLAKITSTPRRTVHNTATDWLKTDISPLPSKPSPELEKFLSLGSRNIVNEVINRANILVGAIFPCTKTGERLVTRSLLNVNLMDSLWSGEERDDALKLYYKILESICTSEVEKLNSRDLSCLLTNEKFHRCLLACSAELVSMSRTKFSILFQLTLERAGITAFDVSKVIESFIKHEDTLPRELRRHLNSLEETLLESMVWEKGSSLYNSLIVARMDLSEEIKRLKLLAEPMPSLDEIAMNNGNIGLGVLAQQQKPYKEKLLVGHDRSKTAIEENGRKQVKHNSSVSTMKDDSPALNGLQAKPPPSSPTLQTAIISPTQSKTQKEAGAHKNTAVTVLFTKVTTLAALRMDRMAERLKLSKQIREKIYLLFQQILTEKTHLFFNRHVDLIILCCFYGVAKKSGLELTFEELTHNYVKEPQCRFQDFYRVLASWLPQPNWESGENNISIKAFYNEIFLRNVSALVKDIGSAGVSNQVPEVNNNDNCPNTPRPSPFPRIPDLSPKKVSPSQNIYLSPLGSSKKDALKSHVGKSYYAFIGERTSAFQSPSKDLDAINKSLKYSNNKRRRLLNFDDANVTFINDSVVTRSLIFESEKCSG